MSFLQHVSPPTNLQQPEFRFLVDDLFVKLDGVSKQSLGQFRTVSQKKEHIIRSFISSFRTHIGNDIYPAARLIYPDKSGRLYYIRDITLARLVVKMYQIPKNSEDYQVLYYWKQSYHKAKRFSADSNNLRDLPLRASRVIANRRPVTAVEGTKTYTVSRMNQLLDELADAKKAADQAAILKPLLDSLTIPEVRWLLHILLKKSILVRFESYFQYVWHPDAPSLFNICNNLQKTFNYLTDPEVRLSPAELTVFPTLPFKPQLSMKLTKNYEKLVQDMASAVPMDANLQALYDKLELKGKFFIEEKMDGDRMVLHKKGKHFKFYSRRLKDYSFLYGENYEFGSLTKYLPTAFPEKVDSIILDGEMVAWDFRRNVILPFGTLKSSAIQESVRQYTTIDQYEQQSSYPFFLVFDVLHINGINLTNHPLFFRKDLLAKLINPIPNRLEILPAKLGATVQDLKTAISEVVSTRSEGILVKHVQLKYLLNHRNTQWVKVKPEYLEKFGENLDLAVIGKIPGIKNSYMCGLKGEEDGVFHSFCTVANGFTIAEYDKIERITNNKWVNYKDRPPPSSLIQFGTKKPVVWINPKDSVVLEIKARSIDSTEEKTYSVGTTLHNLYCRSIREDKTYEDSITIEEYHQIKERYTSDINKEQVANRKRRLQLDSFEQMKKPKEVEVESALFKPFNFIILSDSVDVHGIRTSKEQLSVLVKKHGGEVIQSLNSRSARPTIVITEKELPSSDMYFKKGLDLIRPRWIFECIEKNWIVPLEPVFITKSESHFSSKVDRFGDSYINHVEICTLGGFGEIKLKALDEYRELFIDELVTEELEVPLRYLFHNIKFYVLAPTSTHKRFLQDRIELYGGQTTPKYSECSFIVVEGTDEETRGQVDQISHDIAKNLHFTETSMEKIPSIVTSRFVDECIERNVLVDGDDFKYV
ncbi:DNA ligase IV [Suhomyces tanzawaensis NRRL Y-17324]|uniref:DNA ligase n=1 Tax=Suhomyces tanzawaensis NRRL Y-17324 TaxID=984487 RepID=A0A1E4SHH7_9ASCO|nr:DNA ligase IV [Suhomyces tanzawaensis NRRL Y-17324]ODV78946.1 DNA ligase IV [Suhomyces tanzawaensis NRRL Y-17324]